LLPDECFVFPDRLDTVILNLLFLLGVQIPSMAANSLRSMLLLLMQPYKPAITMLFNCIVDALY